MNPYHIDIHLSELGDDVPRGVDTAISPSMPPAPEPPTGLMTGTPPEPEIDQGAPEGLAEMLLGEFETCRSGRLIQEKHWVAAMRQYRGVYAEEEYALIKPGKSRVFVGMTKQKVDSTTARLMSLLFPASGERNWTISPTPTPTMDPQILQMEQERAAQEGRQPKTIHELAQERADAMDQTIFDQLTDTQGRKTYRECCRGVLFEALVYGTGMLKGPLAEVRKGRRLAFDQTTGSWGMFPVEDGSADEIRPYLEHTSVWDTYLDQGTTNPRDMRYVWQVHTWTARDIIDRLAGEPLFDAQAIEEYLREQPDGDVQPYWWESDLRGIGADAGSEEATRPTGRYRVYERWGQISARQLREAGFPVEADDDRMLDANVWLLGSRIIKLAPVPIAGFGIPVYVMYYHKDQTSIWGDGLPWVMRDLQSAMNALIRMALDNTALATAPQMAINYGAMSGNPDLNVFPGKVWAFESAEDMREAMQVWTIPSNVRDLLSLFTLLQQICDEMTVPRYLSGDNTGVTGAGNTATGLSMLMNAANLTIQDLVRNFDDGVTTPLIRAMYAWNMALNASEEIMGDFDVSATGASQLMVREAATQKMVQAFQITNSPRFTTRVKDDLFLSEMFKMFNLPENLLRTETEFQQFQQQQVQQQALAQAQAQVTASMQELQKRGVNPQVAIQILMRQAAQGIQAVNQLRGQQQPGGLPQEPQQQQQQVLE